MDEIPIHVHFLNFNCLSNTKRRRLALSGQNRPKNLTVNLDNRIPRVALSKYLNEISLVSEPKHVENKGKKVAELLTLSQSIAKSKRKKVIQKKKMKLEKNAKFQNKQKIVLPINAYSNDTSEEVDDYLVRII